MLYTFLIKSPVACNPPPPTVGPTGRLYRAGVQRTSLILAELCFRTVLWQSPFHEEQNSVMEKTLDMFRKVFCSLFPLPEALRGVPFLDLHSIPGLKAQYRCQHLLRLQPLSIFPPTNPHSHSSHLSHYHFHVPITLWTQRLLLLVNISALCLSRGLIVFKFQDSNFPCHGSSLMGLRKVVLIFILSSFCLLENWE